MIYETGFYMLLMSLITLIVSSICPEDKETS